MKIVKMRKTRTRNGLMIKHDFARLLWDLNKSQNKEKKSQKSLFIFGLLLFNVHFPSAVRVVQHKGTDTKNKNSK